jgi:PPOX class probable F420-dependent enzyme
VQDALRRERARVARVAHLGTVRADGRPHVVPCCFALAGDVAYTAIDDVKPKSTLALRRLDNIRRDPSVTLLVDHYADDWSTLWWVRVDGRAAIAEPGSPQHATGQALLAAKYEQYRRQPPPGAVIAITIDSWHAWP